MLPITPARALALACLIAAAPARAAEPPLKGFGRLLAKTLGYLPSRVLDGLDPFRVRLRVGSGAAVSARASQSKDFFSGSYSGIYVGLPGPRGPSRSRPRPPLGLEARASTALAPSDVASGPELGPTYTTSELATGFQLYVLGLEVGLDPVEIADWLVGFAAIDLRGDDLSLKVAP
jgi:hypothetical protein